MIGPEFDPMVREILIMSRLNGTRRKWGTIERDELKRYRKVYEGTNSMTIVRGKTRTKLYDEASKTDPSCTGIKVSWGELARFFLERSGEPYLPKKMFPCLSPDRVLSSIQVPIYLNRSQIRLRHLGRKNAGSYVYIDIDRAYAQLLQRLPGPVYNYDPIRGLAEGDRRWLWPDESLLDNKWFGRAIWGSLRSEQESRWWEYGEIKSSGKSDNRYLCPQTCLYLMDVTQAIAAKALDYGAYRWHTDGGYFPQDCVKGFQDFLESYLGITSHVEGEGYLWANREGEIFHDEETDDRRYHDQLYETEKPLKNVHTEWVLGSFAIL